MARGAEKPPSRELRRLTTRIDVGIGLFARARKSAGYMPTWPLRHAWMLSNVACRHAEATVLLAQTDVVLAPAGWVSARATVEAAAQFLWLLEPKDEFERQARWLALMYEGGRFGQRKEVAHFEGLRQRSIGLEQIADRFAVELPDGYSIPQMPGVMKILPKFGPRLASFYVDASQYAHAAEWATAAYSREHRDDPEHGDYTEYGDFVTELDWARPLWIAWEAFRVTAATLIVIEDKQPLPDHLGHVDHQIEQARQQFLDSLDLWDRDDDESGAAE